MGGGMARRPCCAGIGKYSGFQQPIRPRHTLGDIKASILDAEIGRRDS